MTPIFTSGKMKMMFDIVNSIGDHLVEVVGKDVQKSKTVEVRTWAARFTADVIGNVAFGLECNCRKFSPTLSMCSADISHFY